MLGGFDYVMHGMRFGELYLFCDEVFIQIVVVMLESPKSASSFWRSFGSGLSVTERSLERYMQC